MAGKRKGGKGGPGTSGNDEEGAFKLPKAPEKLASPFKGALGSLKQQLIDQEKQRAEAKKQPPKPMYPAPPPVGKKARAMAEDDATALSLAMQGVKPLEEDRAGRVSASTPRMPTRTAKVAPFGSSAEDDARRRLDALVAEDVSFQVERDTDYVRGQRTGIPSRVVRDLARRARVNDTLDLHGKTQREARDAIIHFVRGSFREGLDILCIVHGKGHHSEGGHGVLRDVAVSTLTESVAAQNVLAFVTAPEPLGGSGALLVELKR